MARKILKRYEDIEEYFKDETQSLGSKLITTKEEFELIRKENPNTYLSQLKLTFAYVCGCGNTITTFSSFKSNKKKICKSCANKQTASKSKRTNDDFIKEVYNQVENEYTFLEDYINTDTPIKVKHNICGSVYTVTPNGFLNAKNRCSNCVRPNYNKDTQKFKEEVFNMVGNEYEVISEYLGSDKYVKIKHITCKHIFNVKASNFLDKPNSKGTRCPLCSNHITGDTETYKQKVFKIVGDEYSVLGEFQDVDTPIKMKHNACDNIWDTTTPYRFLNGSRCPTCSKIEMGIKNKNLILAKKGSFYDWCILNNKEQYLELWDYENNIISPKEINIGTHDKYSFKCENNKHKTYLKSIETITKYKANSNELCPECVRERQESFLQEKVRLYLNELGYTMLHEYKCNIIPRNPKTKYPLPFDNEVIELKLVCEVHGKQHYEITGFAKLTSKKNNTTPEHELHMRKVIDRYKRIYAKSKKYDYLEIPYWTEKDESYKDLINNKIKEILDKQLNKVI